MGEITQIGSNPPPKTQKFRELPSAITPCYVFTSQSLTTAIVCGLTGGTTTALPRECRVGQRPGWVKPLRQRFAGPCRPDQYQLSEDAMSWTKPEFEIVDVTMEVTAYVARR